MKFVRVNLPQSRLNFNPVKALLHRVQIMRERGCTGNSVRFRNVRESLRRANGAQVLPGLFYLENGVR